MKPLAAAAVVLLCASGYFALVAATFAPRREGAAPAAMAHLASDEGSAEELPPIELVAAPAPPAPQLLEEQVLPWAPTVSNADVLGDAAARAGIAVSLLEEAPQAPHSS